jgi:hypothetical protein
MKPPFTTRDDMIKREWVHTKPLRYYLYHDEERQVWFVVDRETDVAATQEYKSKQEAIDAFLREYAEYTKRSAWPGEL